jgi:hypothetical protein
MERSTMSTPEESRETRQIASTSYACPTCGMVMRVASVEPDGPVYEKRMFDCAGCNQSKTVRVKYR